MMHTAFVLTPLEEKIITAYKSGMKPVEITLEIGHKKASRAVSAALEKHRAPVARRAREKSNAYSHLAIGRERAWQDPWKPCSAGKLDTESRSGVVCEPCRPQSIPKPAQPPVSETGCLAELLDGPVQPGDVDAMLEALRSEVAVPSTPQTARSQAAVPSPTAENASEFPTSRESGKLSAGACASGGVLMAAEYALAA